MNTIYVTIDLTKSYDFDKLTDRKNKQVKSENTESNKNTWLIEHRQRICIESIEKLEEGVNLNGIFKIKNLSME